MRKRIIYMKEERDPKLWCASNQFRIEKSISVLTKFAKFESISIEMSKEIAQRLRHSRSQDGMNFLTQSHFQNVPVDTGAIQTDHIRLGMEEYLLCCDPIEGDYSKITVGSQTAIVNMYGANLEGICSVMKERGHQLLLLYGVDNNNLLDQFIKKLVSAMKQNNLPFVKLCYCASTEASIGVCIDGNFGHGLRHRL